MLTSEQRNSFSLATAAYNMNAATGEDWAALVEPEQAVETHETVEDHERSRGRAADRTKDTSHGTPLVWTDVQMAKGRRRGDMFLMDFGTVRAAFFTGEAA